MAVPASPPPIPVPEVELTAGLDERRRRALDEAVADATTARVSDPDSWEPAIALRRYGPGCLALALAGAFDPSGVERLRGLDLARMATVELVVDLSRVVSDDPSLLRALATVRDRLLRAGTRVELHGPLADRIVDRGRSADG